MLVGQILTAAQGQNPARQAAMLSGIPKEVPSTSINMLCGSGTYTYKYMYIYLSNKNISMCRFTDSVNGLSEYTSRRC